MSSLPSGDLTPTSGSPTDVAALGIPKPAHECTAEEELNAGNWDAIAASPEFNELLSSKARFIVPTTIFFVVYYFALPVLVGWFPELMKTRIGSVNLAYLFALSQFFMAWIVAGIYVLKASAWDKSAAQILAKDFKR